MSQHVGGVGRAYPSQHGAAGWTLGRRMPRARVPLGDELWGYYHFVSERSPHVFTWQRLRSVTTVVCQK